MRGIKAKRLRKLGLKSGPAEKPDPVEHIPREKTPWARSSNTIREPHPSIQKQAEEKRRRRRERNLRNAGR